LQMVHPAVTEGPSAIPIFCGLVSWELSSPSRSGERPSSPCLFVSNAADCLPNHLALPSDLQDFVLVFSPPPHVLLVATEKVLSLSMAFCRSPGGFPSRIVGVYSLLPLNHAFSRLPKRPLSDLFPPPPFKTLTPRDFAPRPHFRVTTPTLQKLYFFPPLPTIPVTEP